MDHLAGYIVTGLVSLVVGFLLQRTADKSNLKYFLPGNFLFELDDPDITLQTDSLTIQNFGRKPATNIEIVHKVKPDHFQFSQAISYEEEFNPNGEHLMKITSLGYKEHVNIQYLSHTKLPVLLSIRSDEGPADLIHVQFQKALSKFHKSIIIVLSLIGFSCTAYVFIQFI